MQYLLHHVLANAASAFPEREAVRYGDQSMTYAELDHRSTQLAHALRAQGVERGDRVGIHLPKGLESAAALYGILKAGAAYVPADLQAPPARLAFVLADSGVRHLITAPALARHLRDVIADGHTLSCCYGVDAEAGLPVRSVGWAEISRYDGVGAPPVRMVDTDLSYILYTSGTTGKPKGMMHTHRSALSFVRWGASTFGLQPDDRVASHAPLTFDLSIFDYFSAHARGAATIVVPEEYKKIPASLSAFLEQEKITILYAVPAALTQLLMRGVIGQRDLSSLRAIIFGGESFPAKYLRELMMLLPGACFTHVYGVTETNVCTYHPVTRPPGADDDFIPIGRVCENMDYLVVDDRDCLVAAGESGELLIRGSGNMEGYVGLSDLNDIVFVRRRSPTGQVQEFLRTGDLVQEIESGTFRFVGRRDRQVKIRGHRVELEEVELALGAHPQVDTAVVFPIQDDTGSTAIEALVVVPDGDASLTEQELRRFAASRLPKYAIPRDIELLGDVERLESGKIDRQALLAARNARRQASKTR